jgi:ABC-2 type transport system permease protein
MSTAPDTATDRDLSAARQFAEMFRTDLARLVGETRTKWLTGIQLLPVVGAVLLVFWASLDGLTVFTTLVESALFPFLMPLVAIFYGGPVIVDEIERKTLTYLTLRPVPKPIIFTAKWAAGTTLAVGLVVVPILLLYLICIVLGGSFGASAVSLVRTLVAATLGTGAYTAIFAALSALFSKRLVASVIYVLVFDLVMGQIPVLKLATPRYHIFQAGNAEQQGGSELLSTFLSGGNVAIPWWGSAAIVAAFAAAAVAVGTIVFTRRQYEL